MQPFHSVSLLKKRAGVRQIFCAVRFSFSDGLFIVFDPLRRVDYLLMNMIGLSRKITSENPAYGKLVEAIELLRSKRNLMS